MARVAIEYLSFELDINAYVKKYSDGLAVLYEPIPKELFSKPAEEIIKFLGEIEAGETAVELLEKYTYFKLYFEALNVSRKLKILFGTIEDGVKTPPESYEETLKSFRAYVFGLRSQAVPIPPNGWELQDDQNIPKLAELIKKPTSIIDIF